MHSRLTNPGRVLATAAAISALAVPAAAGAAEQADLRVEGSSKTLAAATYVTDTAKIRTTTAPPTCNGTGATKTVSGPTAIGLLASAAGATSALTPFAVSDEFDFGLLVCGIGDLAGTGTDAFWLYKVDHKSPEVGADQYALKGGEEVLWYYSDSTAGSNVGDELAVTAPARAKAGASVNVTVYAYDAAGARKPAAGASVGGQTTDAAGKATVTAPARGTLRLRATRAGDIRSATAPVCVAKVLKRCASRHGKRLFGTDAADRLAGTGGSDTILARGGADRISVRGGAVDLVRCGKGRDRVTADRKDRVGRDCEIVKRR